MNRNSSAGLAPGWIACPECEAPCRQRDLPPRSGLRCARCGSLVQRARRADSLQVPWALASTGLLLVLLANVEPVLTFNVAGDLQSNRIFTGAWELVRQGYWPVALLVCFAGIVAPFLHLGSVAYVTSACCLRLHWPFCRQVLRFTGLIEAWNLVPVYMVATLVAVVKLDMLGVVYWQQGALWILALSLCSLMTVQMFDEERAGEILAEIRR